MRIFLIPLSRSTKMLHCHSTLTPSATSYLNRATTWASMKWESLSQAPPDGMKRKLYVAGTRMLEKIEHQETFFKEVPSKEDAAIISTVPFMYPSALKEAQVQAEFRTIVSQRIPYHRKYMIYSALWVPVTSLFVIVPIVPNIPLFYNTYRLWSHWKAYNGAKQLDLMVKNGNIAFQPSDVLNFGLHHDPEFAVFFTGSDQLFQKRHAWMKMVEQEQQPIITESSGEITPSLAVKDNGSGLKTGSESGVGSGQRKPKTLDPMSMTDHVVHEGFLTDAETHAICTAFEHAPMMSREIKRARHQEAEKFIKAKLMDKSVRSKQA
ncbi:hypothetical protein BG011_005351 [Mortierella polycephala]|uniref:Mitochondrial K+-H+ exchange-related-domain-containing protein n=1 Tax=Mortierella polycephala TaxID=41804 RepID=A0A9P6U0F6_9FUNG|nr:hypothetical protein BG011_005351 [Mortierella polycephala]